MEDLNVPTEIEICPTVREADGLAMSSRNAYLSPAQRQRASALWRSLLLAEQMRREGTNDVSTIKQAMQQLLAGAELEVQYLAFLSAGTVREVTTIEGPTVVAVAARLGQTRLIDNHTIG